MNPEQVPLVPPSPPVLSIPCIGKGPKQWDLTQAKLDEWRPLYPGLDLLQEVRSAKAWAMANGLKTHRGMERYLVDWFNRSIARGRGRNGPGKPEPGKTRITGPSIPRFKS